MAAGSGLAEPVGVIAVGMFFHEPLLKWCSSDGNYTKKLFSVSYSATLFSADMILLQLTCFQAAWILTFLKAYLDLVSLLSKLNTVVDIEYDVAFMSVFLQLVVLWLSSLCTKCCLLHLIIVARSELSKQSFWAWPACLQGLLILQICKHVLVMTSVKLLLARHSVW